MDFETATCKAQELPEGNSAPDYIHILPTGYFRGMDGRSWVLDHPQNLIAEFNSSNADLPVDYEHQSEERKTHTGPIPAAGWITKLDLRKDGIWGRVKWTETAANLVANKEYRYVSPVFRAGKYNKRISKLLSVGLVHRPNLDQLKAMCREETTMSNQGETTALCSIANALGLPDDADEEKIIITIKKLRDEPDPSKYIPLDAVRDLMTERNSQMNAVHETNVETVVSNAIEEGYITPGMKDWATELCRQNPDSFAEFTKSCGPVYAYLSKSPLDGKSLPTAKMHAPDEAEAAVCRQLGIDPSNLAER